MSEYTKKLLAENIDYHNKNVCYKLVLEKHNLLNEAEELLTKIYGSDNIIEKEKEDGRNNKENK